MKPPIFRFPLSPAVSRPVAKVQHLLRKINVSTRQQQHGHNANLLEPGYYYYWPPPPLFLSFSIPSDDDVFWTGCNERLDKQFVQMVNQLNDPN